ncbi:hypothetical protein DXV75_00010 [Alteromonas aestuariivivens]|uniref:SMODS and SLOG-associating 2TM effector domain-containing protein n=1 Tax=Alteromonas aestuariivivens TaxID=1938339 RepID=A0A3D8MDS5_9ALTE|nr:hypothetical protein [Alteromonas aestuariivivens]RDV28892.1 hypothetical protein DXV75_00010 [Alteromonas aestuariivivens]
MDDSITHLPLNHGLINDHKFTDSSSQTPFVIGITGHRNLDESATDYGITKITELIERLQARLKHTPLIAITGMADGADRVLAKAALACNVRVHVHLPLPLQEYQKDFNESSWHEFQQIIANDRVSVQVVEQLYDKQDHPPTGLARDQQYWVLGQHLISASNLLIAMWDGENTGLVGGTSDVLLDYLNILPGPAHKPQSRKTTPVSYVYMDDASQLKGRIAYWLPVKKTSGTYKQFTRKQLRRSDCYLSGELGNNELECFPAIPSSLMDDLKSLDEYNAKVAELLEQGEIQRDYSLLRGYNKDKSPIPFALLESLDEEFLKADAVAVANQKHSDSQFALFSIIAASMGLLFLLYAKIVADSLLLIGYLLLLIIGLIYYKKIQQRHSFTHHLSSRALAETLRTQFYLTLIRQNNHRHPPKIMNYCGVSQFRGVNWIKQIILSKVPMHLQHEKKDTHLKYNLDFVVKNWVQEQAEYFTRKSKNLSERHHKLERIKQILFVTSAGLAAILVLFKYQLMSIEIYPTISLKNVAILLMGLLPFLLGIWEIYQTKMAVKELFWQYRNQAQLFDEAIQHIESATTNEQQCSVITELAERAMTENYIWIIHRFHREHEPPSAG